MTLGEQIYKLRTGKNLSQGDLAAALDVSRQSISKWETNTSVPELDKLVKLSEIFGVTLDELVTGSSKPEPQAAPDEPQVIYVEKPVRPSFTVAQILGIILLSCSLLGFILFAAFGKQRDLSQTLILCLPIALWGALCFMTQQTLLWCCWCGSLTWWVYFFILAAKWEQEILLLLVGIVLVAVSLWYTAFLQQKGRIHVPFWVWVLLIVVLVAAALLLTVNLLPPITGSITRPSEITAAPGVSIVPE